MYQASLYQYNQRAEVPVQRRGTIIMVLITQALVAYRGLNVDFDIFVKDTDRKSNHYITKLILLQS